MTVKEPREEDSVGFNQLLKEEDVSGLSEDERMARIAKKMEMKFKQEGSQRDEEQPINDSTDIQNDEKAAIITTTTAAAGGKLDDKMQRQKLKDRYLQKKKSRKNKNEKAEDDGEFNEQDED
eukprot:Seg2326.5 transcript_id=Seg2326.5/GoldUCD/mRNA.D3Y31 product="hypothetical protein" protein_id=Seg2326.5/GoldUCD/D3Y31